MFHGREDAILRAAHGRMIIKEKIVVQIIATTRGKAGVFLGGQPGAPFADRAANSMPA